MHSSRLCGRNGHQHPHLAEIHAGLLGGIAALAAACSPITVSPSHTPTSSATTAPPHVMVIVLENREYSDVVASANAPYLNHLISVGGLATASYAVTHPSLPNYIALISGNTFGITSDCTNCMANGPNLADQMLAAGFTWRGYMESMPFACYPGPSTDDGSYAKKHNPFMYFPQIANTPERCANVVPMTQMSVELNSADSPDFAFAVPNLCDDGHNCGTSTADSWLASHIPSILSSSWYQANGTVIITWDEGSSSEVCCNGAAGGHIATIVLSGKTVPGSTMGTPVDHYGVLRTLEAIYGLTYLGQAACTCSGSLSPLLSGYVPQR